MASVTINFLGVCTIFRNLPNYVPDDYKDRVPANRVVLPRSTDAFVKMTGVEPHIAKLQLLGGGSIISGPRLPPASEENTYLLDGVGLTIESATGPELGPPRGLDCLPSLSTFFHGTLGMPAPGVYIPEPENVQAWFDFEVGNAQAYVMNVFPPCATVPSITVLTMTTDDAQPIRLHYTPWGGDESVFEFTGAPARIDVMNFALGLGVVDDNRDFLLNYTLIQPFPRITDVQIPRANSCALPSPGQFRLPRCGDAGPGCSNTNYP